MIMNNAILLLKVSASLRVCPSCPFLALSSLYETAATFLGLTINAPARSF